MKLTSLLDRRFLLPRAKAATKEEAIALLADLICSHTELRDRKELVLKAVMEREALGGTTFPTGIAIPHARIAGFDDMLIGVCVPDSPIRAEGIDVRMVVLILTSAAPSTIYLNTLATLTRLSQNAALFERLVGSATAREMCEAIEGSGIEIKRSFTVADIMSSSLHTVSPATTLKDVIDLFYKHRISYAPVVDEGGRFVGEVTVLELLRPGMPDYTDRMANLRFLADFAPLEQLLAREGELAVRDVMRKPQLHLSADDSVIHAAFELHRHRRRHLPVTDGERVVGVVSYMDLVDKVLRR